MLLLNAELLKRPEHGIFRQLKPFAMLAILTKRYVKRQLVCPPTGPLSNNPQWDWAHRHDGCRPLIYRGVRVPNLEQLGAYCPEKINA
jgi:hypothetical protein